MTTATKATQAKATPLIPGWFVVADGDKILCTLDVYDVSGAHWDAAKNCVVISMRTGWWLGYTGISVADVTAAVGEAAEHRRAAAAGKRSQKRDAKRPQPRTGAK